MSPTYLFESEQSNHPYILVNFPRMELIFSCDEKKPSSQQGKSSDRIAPPLSLINFATEAAKDESLNR
jgi:hypothetical protein